MKQFESFGLDSSNECLWQSGAQIDLPPKPFAVLRYLVENPGRLITHDELLDALWPETFVQPQVLRTYMLDIRKVLGDDANEPRFIQTVPKRGYRFVAPVTDAPVPDRRAPSAPLESPPHPGPKPSIAEAKAGIVGRERELTQLLDHAQSAASGSRRIVFVTGEAGIGKTRLLDELCRRLAASSTAAFAPAMIARGQCVEGLGTRESYYPVKEALEQICASDNGDAACRILARLAPSWLAALGRDSGSQARPADHELPSGSLCAALEELAADKPLILLFEDLHWADEPTLRLISALARRRTPSRLAVLATCKPTEGAADHPLTALKNDLFMRRLAESLSLAPLTKPEVRTLIGRELRQETLPPGLETFVLQRSEGNPLFVIASVEHLIAEGFLVRKGVDGAARWEHTAPFHEIEAEVPHEIAQMIELELQRLAPAEQRILEAGSLMSVAFPAWAVAAALNEDSAAIEEACDGLARRMYFVHRAGQDELPNGGRSAFYAFAHELYREVLYRRQPAPRRAARHVRIAERLGELFQGREASVATEMSLHFEAAGEWPRAIDALRSAARHAHARRSPANAAELLERALGIAANLGVEERAQMIRTLRGELSSCRGERLESLAACKPGEQKLDEFWTGT